MLSLEGNKSQIAKIRNEIANLGNLIVNVRIILKRYYRNNLLNIGYIEMNNESIKRQDFVDNTEISFPITARY